MNQGKHSYRYVDDIYVLPELFVTKNFIHHSRPFPARMKKLIEYIEITGC